MTQLLKKTKSQAVLQTAQQLLSDPAVPHLDISPGELEIYVHPKSYMNVHNSSVC